MELCHNANVLGVDLFSTPSDCTKWQPQCVWEGTCNGKNADMGEKSMPFI
jgi:hypothetical protein